MSFDIKSVGVGAAIAVVVLCGVYAVNSLFSADRQAATAASPSAADRFSTQSSTGVVNASPEAQRLQLSSQAFAKFKVMPVAEREFKVEREAVGMIDFNREMAVDVFTPFPGRIIALFAKAGDDVRKGDLLFTVDSPDLVQAESTLISATGNLEAANRALARAKELFVVQGASQKDLDQATADQQTAEGAVKAARDALRIYGRSNTDIERIVAERKIDSALAVHSPITGHVTARSAAPGTYVQPGNAPAPFAIADVSTMWMVANVSEADFSLLKRGQELDVRVAAYPESVFRGKIVRIGAVVDPSTRRIEVRSEIRDPQHELRAGMFARFVIHIGTALRSLAVPTAGVVREGDGTMSVWVAGEGTTLTKRTVKVGLQQNDWQQIVEGLKPGERVATEGALFLNNALATTSR